MLDGAMQKSLSDRALHVVITTATDCANKEQKIHILTALREYATVRLSALLDGKK